MVKLYRMIDVYRKQGPVWVYVWSTKQHKTLKSAIEASSSMYPAESFKAHFSG